MGIRKTEKQKNARFNKIETGEQKLTDLTTSMKNVKENTQKDRDTEEQKRLTGAKGIH